MDTCVNDEQIMSSTIYLCLCSNPHTDLYYSPQLRFDVHHSGPVFSDLDSSQDTEPLRRK